MMTFIVTAVVALISYVFFSGYQNRKLVAQLRHQGKVDTPSSPFFIKILLLPLATDD